MDKKKLYKRILGLILSVTMIIGLIPIRAGAEGIIFDESEASQTITQPLYGGEGDLFTVALVTGFDDLPDYIRWQNTSYPYFPESVTGQVYGEYAQIPITWETDQNYDENYPERGLYVFKSLLEGDYILDEGLEPLTITVFIPESMGSFSLFARGSGGSGDPLEISTASQLKEIANLVNSEKSGLEKFLFNNPNAEVSLKLTNNIDLSIYGRNYNNGQGWEPIGNSSNSFKGYFDGDGHIITGLYIDRPDEELQGLFGYIDSGGRVESLGIVNAHVRGKEYVGIVAGIIRPSASVEKSFTSGRVGGDSYVGGIGGQAGGNIINSYSMADVSGSADSLTFTGGIVGLLSYQAINTEPTIKNTYSTGKVTAGGKYVGGLAGSIYNDTKLENSIGLNPSVSGLENYLGRIIGDISGGSGTNNHAFNGTRVNDNIISGGSNTNKNGSGKSASEIKGLDFFENIFDDANAWEFETGKLPILAGFEDGVQDNEIPDYIIDISNGKYFIGEGTEETPYKISTPEQLARLAEVVNNGDMEYKNNYYKLMNDIDLSAYGETWNDGKGWIHIGIDWQVAFNGNFNGNGKVITGLYIDRPDEDYQGLFGCIGDGSKVENLGIVNAHVRGNKFVGIIGGFIRFNASVEKSFTSGRVSGNFDVGGIGGFISGKMVNAYSRADVTGGKDIGGIVGSLAYQANNTEPTIKNTYSTGKVTTSENYVGGITGSIYNKTKLENSIGLNPSISGLENEIGRIIGDIDEGSAKNNYAFAEMKVNGAIISDGSSTDKNGEGKSIEEIKTENFFESIFIDDNAWVFETGKLPILKVFGEGAQDSSMPFHLLEEGSSPFSGGNGSEVNPYQISTPAQLAKLVELIDSDSMPYKWTDKHYKLTDDLDLSAYGKNYDNGRGWLPNSSKPFMGCLDGDGHTIRGLYINRPESSHLGLFGSIVATGKVKNLALLGIDINGQTHIGGITGSLEGNLIENCYVSGTIKAGLDSEYLGGIVGFMSGGSIKKSSANILIKGDSKIGGIVGVITNDSPIRDSYSSGLIEGKSHLGGIIGDTSTGSLISNSYSLCEIVGQEGGDYIGGLAGQASLGTIQNSLALNPSIRGSGLLGRIGENPSDEAINLKNNYAFADMKINGHLVEGGQLNNGNGRDINISDIYKAEFWTNENNWSEPDKWDEDIWEFADGKLPILKSFSQFQSGDGGLYLVERDIKNASPSKLEYSYTGEIVYPIIEYGGQILIKDRDYTIEIVSTDSGGDYPTSGGKNIGQVTAKLIGKGSFTGTKENVFYWINKADQEPPSPFVPPYYPPSKPNEGENKEESKAEDRQEPEDSLKEEAEEKNEKPPESEGKIENPFKDIGEDTWFSEPVKYMYQKALMKGTSEDSFNPKGRATRGMIVTILHRLEGEPLVGGNIFTDVDKDKYYADPISWAIENNIVNGYGNNKFGPEDPITREQLAVILLNYAKFKGYDLSAKGDLSNFEDKGQISDWARDAMEWANGLGLIQGKSKSKLDPKGYATRAEIATILYRFLTKIADI